MTTTTTNPTADEIAETAAEAHRVEHAHTVALLPGAGWLCEVCDADDFDETIADYAANGPGAEIARRPRPPAEFEIVSSTVLGDSTVVTARCVDGGTWTIASTDDETLVVKPTGAHVTLDLFAPGGGALAALAETILDLAVNGADPEPEEPVTVRFLVLVADTAGDGEIREFEVDAVDARAARRAAEDAAREDGIEEPEAFDVEEIPASS